ncbi:hypothetical protein [Nonomuraea typhae]|uniref:hypothetical protein n=1 Tax=Nonomuraea typhae TaxID=2603600 RepID=UPI0012FC41F9|nr:hypothetical protein [Nonomuraea typhae]
MTDPRALAAARNNAEWCDLMSRAHGVTGEFGARVWRSARRTPPYYPDAVTLDPAATAADVLDGIDAGPWASVKDSFAALEPFGGFEVLFAAQWIHRDAPVDADLPGEVNWSRVEDAADLRAWERAWNGGRDNDLFRPAILAEAAVLAGRVDGEIVCGAVLNAGDGVAGVSNVFAAGRDVDDAWAGALAMAARLFPGRPLVGYESDVEPAERHGFTPVGALRVWLKESG